MVSKKVGFNSANGVTSCICDLVVFVLYVCTLPHTQHTMCLIMYPWEAICAFIRPGLIY